MLRHLAFGLALGATAVLAACATPGAEISVMTSDTVSVRAGSTYAWGPAPTNTDPRAANDIVDQRIRRAVEQSLGAKGYRLVSDATTADLTVTYHVALQDREERRIDTWAGSAGPWGFYGPPTINAYNITYTEGALILDLTDRASQRLAWRAVSQKRLHRGDAEQVSLDALLQAMTASLPGRPT